MAKRIAILLNPPRGDRPKDVPHSVGEASIEVVLDMERLQKLHLTVDSFSVASSIANTPRIKVGRTAMTATTLYTLSTPPSHHSRLHPPINDPT